MEQKKNIEQLIQQVKKKDFAAMRAIYEIYSKGALASSIRITNDLQASEDILQESFLQSFEKIHQLNENSKYGGWLKRIVIHKSIALTKKRINFQNVELIDGKSEEDVDWYKGVSFRVIQDAIQELPNGCRQIFSLFLLENYKHKEISELLGISVSNSKSQYRYAIKLLRKKLTHIIYG